MSKHYRPIADDANPLIHAQNGLPTNRPIAVYYRQSTEKQVGNISTAIQTIDMVDHLERRGWNKENIYLIDMDAGISGTKRIDQRPGMKRLYELVTERALGAIACQDEDRLFRDVTQIQVNIFIESCRASGVLVITPSMVYDFSHPQYGTFHARQFRFKSEMAAEYLTSFVIGRLHRARMRLMMEGRWLGGSTPPGYVVDMRKHLLDGSHNENWRRFVPFEPYADVVRTYFRIFLEAGGNLGKTMRRVINENIYYPDPDACPPPEGFRVLYGFKSRGGYHPGHTGLRYLLTNAAYLGHWCVNDAVVRWNNHSPIIENETFFAAFNYLSSQMLDGNTNANYRPFRENARPIKEEDRLAERPLFAGMIVSQYNGEWRNVGTEYVKREQRYRYMLYTREEVDEYVWSKNAEWVDSAIVKIFKARLDATFNASVWEQSVDSFDDDYARERKLKVAQVTALEQAMQNLVAGIEQMISEDFIRAAEKRYEDAKTEYKRLQEEIAQDDLRISQRDIITNFQASYAAAVSTWDEMTREEKRVIAQAFIDRIEAIPYDKHGLHIDIYWRDGTQNRASVPRLPTVGQGWSLEEHETLERLLDAKATQLEILATLTDRTWRTIRDRIARTRGMAAAVFTPKPVRDFETYEDYQKRIVTNPKTAHKARHFWRPDEVGQLSEMLDSGTTKMQIAQAFPYCTWTRLRAKISELKGIEFEVSGTLEMGHKQSYSMLLAEAECQEDVTSTINASTMETHTSSMTSGAGSKRLFWKARRPA